MRRIDIENSVLAQSYAETRSVKAVAARHGMSPSTVDKRLRRHGVVLNGPRGMPRKLPPTILNEYQAGMSLNAIARKYSACSATVYEALSKAGFNARARGAQRKAVSDELRQQVIASYEALGVQEKVAAALGIGQTRISRILRAAGVGRPKRCSRFIGRVNNSSGYIMVWVDDDDPMRAMAQREGYVMEHRLVMARHLGRPLGRHETVHHINGDRADNRLENLQLRSGHHGAGVVHRCRDCGSTNVESGRLN